MILKIQYKNTNAVKNTLIDNIEKVDSGETDGVQFINVYKANRKTDDEFTTINLIDVDLFLMGNDGKTLEIYRSRK